MLVVICRVLNVGMIRLVQQGRLSILLMLFLYINPSVSYCQTESSMNLQYSKSEYKGKSSGSDFLKLNGFTLKDILEEVKPDLIYEVKSDILEEVRFDYSYNGDLTNKDRMIEDFNFLLKSNFNVFVVKSKDLPDFYRLEFFGKEGCDLEGTLNSISIINRVWTGKCVELTKIADQIKNWYGLKVVAANDAIIPFITLHHDNLTLFKQYLKKKSLSLTLDTTLSIGKVKYIYR